MALELNGGEGAGPSGWGAALGSGEALGPTYGERGGVRWLGTDGAAENRGGCGGDGFPERGSGWGVDKRTGGVFFYSRALRGGNMGLHKKGKWEVMARRSGRATGMHAREARRNINVRLAAALRGGDVRVFVHTPLAQVSWPRGWRWTGPRGAHGLASAWCLRSAGLGS
jgi:hypothetical protein